VAGLRQSRPDLVEELLADPLGEIARLQEELRQLRAAEDVRNRRATIVQLLAECEARGSMAPDQWQRCVAGESFVETLMGAADEPAMRRLIRERVELVRQIAGCRSDADPVSREQNRLLDQSPHDVESFVRCVSGRGRSAAHAGAASS
ncbi:MAG: hypothetical protein ACYC6Y_23955, partial [Thermoguttaceae bacterium]